MFRRILIALTLIGCCAISPWTRAQPIPLGILVPEAPLGEDWTVVGGVFGFPLDIVPLASHTVSVFFSDGSTMSFEAQVTGESLILAGTMGIVGFRPLSLGAGTLFAVGNEVLLVSGTTDLLAFDTLTIFDPATFLYQFDGQSFTLAAATAMPIPEPGSYALLLAGLALLVLARSARTRALAKVA